MNYSHPLKSEILLQYSKLQEQLPILMVQSEQYKNAGNLVATQAAYDQLIAITSQQLELERLNNLHYPDSPFELSSTVNTLLNFLLMQADVLETLREFDRAEELRTKAAALSKEYLSPSAQAERDRQRASSLISQGRFNEALVFLTSARDRFGGENDPLNLASVTADISNIFKWLGDYERALGEAKRASAIIEPLISGEEITQEDIMASFFGGQLQKAQDQAKLLQISLGLEQVQALTNCSLKNYEEAERQFRLIAPKVPSTVQPAIETQIAAIQVFTKRYDEALGSINRLEPLFTGLLRPKLGVLLKYKAQALLGVDKPDEALTAIETANKEVSSYHDLDSLWQTQWLHGRILEALKRPAQALEAYSQMAETINRLRKAPLGYRLDSTYFQDKLPALEDAINLAYQSDQAKICCHFTEMIKSRSLTAILSIPTNNLPRTAGELDRQVEDLSSQIDALEYLAYREGWSDEIEQKKESLLVSRNTLVERIRFSDPRWRSLSEPVAFDLERILDLLAKRKQAAITLFYQPHRVISILLKDRKCSLAAVSVSPQTHTSLVKYRENLQSTQPKPQLYDPSASLNLSAEQLIPVEILESALQMEGLVIIPYGPLHLLPWAGLEFNKIRLFESCPVSIAPNLSCLSNLQANFSIPPQVALIGAPDYSSLSQLRPLNFATEELQTIQNIYSSTTGLIGDALMGQAATEGGFWQLAKHESSKGNILHIACHGNYAMGDPLNSGLLLADAKIDAIEIARSRLEYNEVILSACNTGYRPTEVKGLPLSGDDILGLPGAFLEAGARSVLVSIPQARDDAALEFMTIYHENRAEAKTPMVALQETQKTMLTNPIYPPYLWIGFTVYGCQ